MKKYDSAKPLISIHVPKCAGGSLRSLLKQWFGENFYKHYKKDYMFLPTKYPLKPGICIHGHFNRTKGFGVLDYYQGVDQMITILRHPLEMAVSNYFFWKFKARQNQLRLGVIQEGGAHDYKNIEDFFNKRPRSPLLNFMPVELTAENYKEVFEKYFLYIGIVEDLQTSVDILAGKLGLSESRIDHINPAQRDEELSAGTRETFIANNRLELEIYQYVRERYLDG